MYKNKTITVSLKNEVLTYEIANYVIDFEVSNGVINNSASYSYASGGALNDKRDIKFLKSFNSTLVFSLRYEYYEILKDDLKIVRLLLDSSGEFGAYYFAENIGKHIQKLELAYVGIVKVAS